MKVLKVLAIGLALLACSAQAPRLVDSEPEANENAIIYDNQMYLEFDKDIDPSKSSVQVFDPQKRLISYEIARSSKDPKVIEVRLEAPFVMGYEAGHYTVKWKVNDGAAEGEFAFHIRIHH